MSNSYESRISRLQEKLDYAQREIAELRNRVRRAIEMQIVAAPPRPFPPTEEMIETQHLERWGGR